MNGSWSEWVNNTATCNVTCGIGFQEQNRTCDSPPATDGGELCLDSNNMPATNETRYVPCVLEECKSK